MKARIFVIAIFVVLILIQGCSPAGGEERGHEFMPDMVHSIAFEANLYDYYYYNTWGSKEEYKKFVIPRQSVAGTIPRGHSIVHYQDNPLDRMHAMQSFDGQRSPTGIAIPPNGSVPYYYGDTEDERTRAMAEIVDNPFPITTEGLERGGELYTIYCGICHGDKADGLGYLVREADPAKGIIEGVYPAAPANLQQLEFYQATNGRYYHSIMYGKNMMGSYADKLSYEERWQVIHYIRSLQAKEQGLVYNQDENTFTQDLPGAHILAQFNEAQDAGGAQLEDEEHEVAPDSGEEQTGHNGGH